MSESLLLDPAEEAGDRVELDITPFVGPAGPDWGDGEVTSYMAEAARGQLPVDFRIPNRMITVPLLLMERGVMTFEEIRSAIQGKAALFQQEGGWIKRETSIGPLYADVVGASLKLGGSSSQAVDGVDPDGVLTLETLPDFYGEWITKGTGLGTGELTCLVNGVLGNYPGRLRLRMNNGTAFDQRGLIWGIRCRHYSALATAALAYDPGSSLTPKDAATTFGAAVVHANLAASWTPVFATTIAGVGEMTHTGTYQVWVRCQTLSDTSPQVRFLWDVGDLVAPSPNAPKRVPVDGIFDINLGQIRLDEVPLGNHRWGGVLQAKGDVGGEQVSCNRIWFVPVDEGYGELRAPIGSDVGLFGYAARDEFNQTAGNLAGKTAPVGGTWAAAGAATGFAVETVGLTAVRSAVSDTVDVGAFAILGSGVLAEAAVEATFQVFDLPGTTLAMRQCVVARYVDVNNWLMAGVTSDHVGALAYIVVKRVASVSTTLALSASSFKGLSVLAENRVRLWVDNDGSWTFSVGAPGAPRGIDVQGVDAALATGGALDDGKIGIYDQFTAAAPVFSRTANNFAVWVPDPDAVIFGSQSVELRTEGMFREDLFGAAWARISPVGDLPRMPPPGSEDRTVEIFVKVSRGDLDQLPDPTPDAFGLVPSYRPSWLTVPGA